MKTIFDLINDMRIRADAIKRLHEEMPLAMGVECVKEIKKVFKKNNWVARKPSTNKAYDSRKGVKGSVVSSSRPVLVQTGNLRDGVSYVVEGKKVKIGVFSEKALKYARIHNEGLPFKAWGKHQTTMPKRKFMPTTGEAPTQEMLKSIIKKFDIELDKIMKDWKR